MDVEHYRTLSSRAEKALDELVKDAERLADFTKAHNYSVEFEHLSSAIDNRPEAKLFGLAIREYQFALYAASTASYRHAHISLRLFLELSLAAIYFSGYEVKLRRWLASANDSDIKWAVVSDSENGGVFSGGFLSAFHPEIQEHGKQYGAIASAVYRECSEFVHGNMHTHPASEEALGYDPDALQSWLERADAGRLCVFFAFAGRYLKLLDRDKRLDLEGLMVETLGHLSAVQQAYA